MSERALAAAYAGHADEAAAALPQRLLNIVLFVTVLTSSIAFIEPSPHDGLMIILLATCVAARVRFDRKLVPLTLLLAVWLAGAFFALIPVLDQKQTVQYVATSAYLVIAAIMFACLFCDGDLVRLLILRRAYVIAALIATAAGYAGFFHLVPGADIFLANDRVSATFKDPNVYGPFLIFPLLLLSIDFMTRRLRLTGLAILVFLIGGLLLSFSRGAWAHFAISAAVTIALLLAAAPEPRMRTRILLFSVAALIGMALFVVALISIPAVHDMWSSAAAQPSCRRLHSRFVLHRHELPNGPRQEIGRLARTYQKLIQQIFADGIAAGEFASDLNPELATLGLLGLCNSVIAARSLPLTSTIDDFIAEYSRIFIHGAVAKSTARKKGKQVE